MESKVVKLIKVESRMMVARVWSKREMGRRWSKGTDLFSYPR